MNRKKSRLSAKKRRSQQKWSWVFRSPWVWFVLFQLLMINGWYLLYQRTILSFEVSAPLAITEHIATPVSPPSSIQIGTAKIDTAITPAAITNGIWETSDTSASHLIYSAKPSEAGNIVIYAHNRRQLFANLSQAEVGDEVIVTTEDGSPHIYVIKELQVVPPDQVEVVMPTETETLTLYTCTGPFDSQRLVVRAFPA